ncbi:MAG TPA: hypothetical protein VIJ82_33495 [Streptosporangiaceae bacterium]
MALMTAVAGQIRRLTADVWSTLELAERGHPDRRAGGGLARA